MTLFMKKWGKTQITNVDNLQGSITRDPTDITERLLPNLIFEGTYTKKSWQAHLQEENQIPVSFMNYKNSTQNISKPKRAIYKRKIQQRCV